MADELTFSDLVDLLADHEGENVYVELGTRDPDHDKSGDAFVLKLHGQQLGAIQDAVDYSTEKRKAVMVRLHPRDEPVPKDEKDHAGTRLFFNPAQVTEIQGDPRRGVKVWIEGIFYVCVNAV